MIYHVIYYFETEKEAQQSSCYFSSKVVNGIASILHGDGFMVPFHLHVLVEVVRKAPFSKDTYNVPGYHPRSVLVVNDLFSTFDYLLTEEETRSRLMCYGSLDKKYKAYLRKGGINY